jgi:hypothetical protein
MGEYMALKLQAPMTRSPPGGPYGSCHTAGQIFMASTLTRMDRNGFPLSMTMAQDSRHLGHHDPTEPPLTRRPGSIDGAATPAP